MKNTLTRISLFLIVLLFIGASALWSPVQAQTPQPTTPPELENTAREFIDLLAQGQFEQAAQAFAPSLVTPELPAQLKQAWESLYKQYGLFEKISNYTPIHQANMELVYVTADFAKGSVELEIAFDQDGQVIGMHFVPTGTGAAAAKPYQTAAYADPQTFSEQEVTVGATGYPLPGTLTMPTGEGPFPAVVLVHGSGPNDRDETIYTNKPFRDLAEGLASQGIAVLRYDKRSKVYGEKMNENPQALTVKEEVTDDALAAIQFLHQTPGIDPQRIYLLGHSLGGMLVPRIAEQAQSLADGGLAGAIVLAGPSRPLEDLIVEQYTYLFGLNGTPTPDQQTQLEQIKEQVAKIKAPDLAVDTPLDQTMGIPAGYWLDLRNYQPAETAKELTIPLLIVRGERDYQVAQADFDGWQAALGDKANVFLKQYPRLNHLFMAGVGASTPQEYQKTAHVSEMVINDIASFINTGKVSTSVPLIGGTLNTQEITRLVLLILPIVLLQLGLTIFALVDLAKRKKTHGPRWLWAVLLVFCTFAVPSGLVVAAIYLLWARKEEEEDDGANDSD